MQDFLSHFAALKGGPAGVVDGLIFVKYSGGGQAKLRRQRIYGVAVALLKIKDGIVQIQKDSFVAHGCSP